MGNPFFFASHALDSRNFLNREDMFFAFLLQVFADAYDLLPQDDPRREWKYPDDAVSEVFARLNDYRDRHYLTIERIMHRFGAGAKYREVLPR
ncbi:hypothetical protein [Lacipirellula parvula]|uniref:Uncharacterized protein n=1 Tax=Lacipirellula parvula TaxID=2650471 RepID=A0A5K7XB31_9BACT|nr:hypothetical protein [Lacipirellula parvula]BBO31556.1 hypothetical protein PLANPX_1168 [Lacipirellula parvula]